ncbi:MAG: alpha-ketoacid dehydrogenase subunit beta [Candidatus Marinimicrobia bacterium]|nr:alpha-ketoacid dehydrogenase subunit beta [Candidatus Neomarinimicrobiota bacterium]|tara:strand:- start:155 stop:1210 length:1056 start_codon:yes stop_codon:yes gene_type:complete
MRIKKYSEAINEAIFTAMELDSSVICYGLGVPDPKGVFGTTIGLQEKFGKTRVFDMPTSENAMTGVAIGASLNGIRPIVTHQRLDFFLLAMDQLINNAAKWHYMFGGERSVPITIRLIIGRGWGQGPTHSQNLQAVFSHIPGLKVVMPTTAADAKGLLLECIFDDNPTIFLEHRWLHNLESDVPDGNHRVKIGKSKILKKGNDVTIVSLSYMTIEALHAIEALEKEGVSCDLIDLRTVKPIDFDLIFKSVSKTGRLLALDTGVSTGSIAGEIIARVSIDCFNNLKQSPQRIAMPDFPTPTSIALSRSFYKRAEDIIDKVSEMLGMNLVGSKLIDRGEIPSDVPGEWFKGPF